MASLGPIVACKTYQKDEKVLGHQSILIRQGIIEAL